MDFTKIYRFWKQCPICYTVSLFYSDMSKKDMKILTNESANVYTSAVVMIYTIHKTVFLVYLRGVL